MRAGAIPPLLGMLVILSVLPVPGGAAPEVVPMELAADDAVTIQSGDTLHLRPEGSIWGRVAVTAGDDLTLSLELSHDTMDDLDVFSDDGEGIYDEEHHTFFYLSPEGAGPYGGYRFGWWGTPQWSIWPSHSGPYSIALDAGDTMDLLALNNVPGFTITLHADDGGTESTFDWQLTDHPGYRLLLPDPESGGVETPVAQSTTHEWDAETEAPAAILKARGWEYRWGGPRITTEEDRLEINGSGSSGSSTSIALTGPGGYHFSASTITRASTSPGEVDFLRYLEHTTAGPHTSEFGAGFLVLPYLPPT